ncbi:MAG TPA: cytochrome b N-terminal domain-containing protein [Polyangiaceae bacterium]|jgi:ubiquinol-cytochrome c reductase cytochrome b subunit
MAFRVGAWLEERTGWRSSLRAWVESPVVGGAPWAAGMAAAVATCVGILALTGITLMTAYGASPQAAWASVHFVQFVQPRGWIVRGLHYWAAQALLVLALVHVIHGALVGVYRKPREVAWWATLAVFGLVVGEAITGGLLPWDERGWWSRVVEGNIIGLAPGIGGWLQQMMAGGSELGALGLARAYAMHVAALPFLILALLALRRSVVRRHGWVDASTAVAVDRRRQLARNALVAVAVIVVVFALTGNTHGAPLEAPADPMGDYPARPEWFLMTLYELRKLFHGVGEFLGTTLLPGLAGAYLALLPWFDGPRRPRSLVVGAPIALMVLGALGLAGVAMRKDAHDEVFSRQRAKAELRASAAAKLAMGGVPPEGALAMVRADPELRGRDLFDQHCASCHVLGDLGDPKKATASKLDGWGTAKWIAAMVHDPDAPEFFGRGPYQGQMPSVDTRPKDKPEGEKWTPIVKSDADRAAVAAFLASQGDEPGEPPSAPDDAARERGEKIVSDQCTSCHLYKGDGDLEGNDDAPELAHYGSIAWTRAQVANPSTAETYRDKALDPERKKHMPRFDKDLSAADVDLVARWVRAHGRGQSLP